MTLRLPTLSPSYIGEPSSPCGLFGPSAIDPQEVGRLARLDAQHRRAVLDEVPRRDRPGRAGAELEDLHAGPRAGCRSRRRSRAARRARRPRWARATRAPVRAAWPRAARPRRRRLDVARTGAGSGRIRRAGRRTRVLRAARSRGSRAASWSGASIRFVSHAMSYSSCIVWRGEVLAESALDRARALRRSRCSWLNVGPVDRWSSASAPGPSSAISSSVSCPRLRARALPPRRPNDTKPSRVGQISRVRPMFAPRRWPAEARLSGTPAIAHVRDEHDLLHRAASTPRAAGAARPTARSAPRTRPRRRCARSPTARCTRTGARSGSPVQYMFPLAAITPRSDARQAARGPSSAERRDAAPTPRAARASGSTVHAPGKPGVSITMSASASSASRRGSSGPSTTTLRLPGAPRGPVGGASARSGSPSGGSTSTTSAPRSASIRPAMAAGSPAEVDDADPVEQRRGHDVPPASGRLLGPAGCSLTSRVSLSWTARNRRGLEHSVHDASTASSTPTATSSSRPTSGTTGCPRSTRTRRRSW